MSPEHISTPQMRGFPVSCRIQVRYLDVDAMDHVNNAVYVTYLEMARTRLWQEQVGPAASARDFPFIVARVVVNYLSPIRFTDNVTVHVGVARIGRTSFTLAYHIEASGRLAAQAETVQVYYDYASGQPMPIGQELRHRLETLLVSNPS